MNGGVCIYFGNVFDQTGKDKLPMIKYKLRKILVDFGMCQTCVEINQELNYIRIWYRDPKSIELKGILLQRFNDKEHKSSQAIEININFEGQVCSPPKTERGIKTYTGLTKFLFQEFIQSTKSRSMADDNPYNEMRTIIQKGNQSPTVPLESILIEEVG